MLFRLFFLLLISSALPAFAQDVVRRLDARGACPVEPLDWFSASEEYAWSRICAGNTAMMSYATGSDDGKGCDAMDAAATEAWPESRNISARFLKLIMTRQPFVSAPAQSGVWLRCARISDQIRLRNEVIQQEIWLGNNLLEGGLVLTNARALRDINLDGARLEGPLQMSGFKTDGDLLMRDGSFRDVRALGMRVGGNFEIDGSKFLGSFNGGLMKIEGGFYLKDKTQFGKDGIHLLGARIDGDVNASGSIFEGPFNADGLTVGSGLYMRGGASFGKGGVDLLGAEIHGVVQFLGSTFDGPIDLTGAVLHDDLALTHDSQNVTWGTEARLILRNAHAKALEAHMPNSWRRPNGPLPVDLQGFTFERLGGLGSGRNADLSQVDHAALIAWIEAPDARRDRAEGKDHHAGYAPQPYAQLASVLNAMGAEASAREVNKAKLRHRRVVEYRDFMRSWEDWRNGPSQSRFATLATDTATLGGSLMLWALVGHGLEPFRVLYWFFGLVLIGTILARWSVGDRRHDGLQGRSSWARFWYSMETAVPLIDLSGNHADIRHGNRFVENWFHFQKIAGFALSTILVGALTILGT